MCSAAECRSSDLAEADARWAVLSVAQASTARPTMTASRSTRGSRRDESDPWWKKASSTTVAMSHACATTRSAVSAADGDGLDDEAPGGARVVQQPGVERAAVPPSLGSAGWSVGMRRRRSWVHRSLPPIGPCSGDARLCLRTRHSFPQVSVKGAKEAGQGPRSQTPDGQETETTSRFRGAPRTPHRRPVLHRMPWCWLLRCTSRPLKQLSPPAQRTARPIHSVPCRGRVADAFRGTRTRRQRTLPRLQPSRARGAQLRSAPQGHSH